MKPDFEPENAAPSTRLTSLDAFRGLTIAGMILVNNPGSWEHVYPPLRHAAWHGWTPTDLVFPSFLFIVGVAIPLAIGKRRERGDATGSIVSKIVIRSLVIFALGLFLAWFRLVKTDSGYSLPELRPSLASLRIPGVLQRIALCYLLVALLYLWTGIRTQIVVTIGLLVGYWAIMKYVPVPGHGVGDLSREHNLAAYVDRLLLPGHLYKKDYDPEGLLSTLPALASTLIGVLTGRWLGTMRTPAEKTCGVFAAGFVLFAIGWGWDASFPINKALWTSSFVLYSAGLSLQVLGLCLWLIEVLGARAHGGRVFLFCARSAARITARGAARKRWRSHPAARERRPPLQQARARAPEIFLQWRRRRSL
jgi:predicted acyltransferase